MVVEDAERSRDDGGVTTGDAALTTTRPVALCVQWQVGVIPHSETSLTARAPSLFRRRRALRRREQTRSLLFYLRLSLFFSFSEEEEGPRSEFMIWVIASATLQASWGDPAAPEKE